jgi:hypothetical protein
LRRVLALAASAVSVIVHFAIVFIANLVSTNIAAFHGIGIPINVRRIGWNSIVIF